MEYRHIITFNQGTPQEIVWDIYVDYETVFPQFQYIAEAHCLTNKPSPLERETLEPCWKITGYATSSLALTSMNNHVVTYIRNLTNPTFQVICHPEETEIVLSVSCLAKTWDISVVSGTASPQNGTGKNYNETVLNCWNAIMTY